MTEFMMIFRHEPQPSFTPTPEQRQEGLKQWQDWIGGIAAQGKFVGANQLGAEGKTLKLNNVITDGPYAEVKEMIGGYLVLKAGSLDEAVGMAAGCPIFQMGGHVEVRNIINMNR